MTFPLSSSINWEKCKEKRCNCWKKSKFATDFCQQPIRMDLLMELFYLLWSPFCQKSTGKCFNFVWTNKKGKYSCHIHVTCLWIVVTLVFRGFGASGNIIFVWFLRQNRKKNCFSFLHFAFTQFVKVWWSNKVSSV